MYKAALIRGIVDMKKAKYNFVINNICLCNNIEEHLSIDTEILERSALEEYVIIENQIIMYMSINRGNKCEIVFPIKDITRIDFNANEKTLLLYPSMRLHSHHYKTFREYFNNIPTAKPFAKMQKVSFKDLPEHFWN